MEKSMADNDKPGDGKQQDITKFLIMTLASIVIMFIVFAGVNYIIMENLMIMVIEAYMVVKQRKILQKEKDYDIEKIFWTIWEVMNL